MAELAEQRARRARLALLVVAGVAFVALRAPFLALPLDRDEGEYAYIAWRMLEGDVPYRDAFDQKPPGIFAVYACVLLLGGGSPLSFHLALLLWSAATAWLLHALVRRLAGDLAAAAAVLVFSVAAADPALGATAANTELFALLPLVAAMLALVRGLEDERPRRWLLCGAWAAAACWFKQVAAANAVFVTAVAVLAPAAGAPRGAAVLRRLGGLALGGLAVSLPVLGVFAAAGASGAFLDAVLLHNLEYARQRPFWQGLDNLRWNLLDQARSLASVWGLALLALLWPAAAGPRARRLLAGWLLFSCVGVAVGWQFRPHYFLQAVPALAALAGTGLAALLRRVFAQAAPPAAALATAVLALAVLAPPVVAHREALFAGSPERTARALYGLNPFPEAPEIAHHIASTSEPEDSVLVVGSEPQLLFQARRRSATRYIFFYPLTGSTRGVLARQQEAMAQVRAGRPRYVVWVNVSTSLLATQDTERWIFDAVDDLLRRQYRLELVVHLDAAREGYAFSHGAAASRWLREHRRDLDRLPWIAVHRRVR